MIKKVVSLLLWSSTSSAQSNGCAEYERKQADGSCATDEALMDQAGRRLQANCDWNLQIKQADGTCKTCGECTRPAQGAPTVCVAGGNWPKSGCVAGKATTPQGCPADSIITTGGCYKCNRGKPDAAQKECVFTPTPPKAAPALTPAAPAPIVGNSQCGWNQIVDSRGLCYSCPTNEIPDASRRVCLRQNLPPVTNCYYNQIRTANGCMTCRMDMVPDAQHRQCLRQNLPPVRNCYFNQIQTASGCETCGGNLIPDASHTVCLRQDPGPHNPSFSCAYNQIITQSGCQTCNGNLVPDAAHRNCLRQSNPPPPPPPVCTSDQILTNSGCVTCGPNLIPDASRRNCLQQYVPVYVPAAPITCPMNQIRIGNNMCTFCQVNTAPDASQTQCVRINRPPPAPAPIVCNDRQIRSSNGGCSDCPNYSKAQNTGLCAPDSCGNNQIVSMMGTCVICGRGQTPSSNGRTCVTTAPPPPVVPRAQCNDREQISSDGRYCSQCQSYTRAQNNNQICAGDSCNSSSEILLPTGLCGRCPANSYPDSNRKQCIRRKAVCGSKERLSNDQRSCIPCPQYTRAQNQNTVCLSDSCYSNQIVTSQGTCSVCPAGQEPHSARRSCVDKISCGPRERLSGNSCVPCATWTRAQDGNTYCAADACSGNQKVNYEGICSDCPAYTIVSSDRRTCVTPSCTGREILESTGKCGQCLPYSKPDAARRNCIADTCGPNSKSTSAGNCEACPVGWEVTADGRFCVEMTPRPTPPRPPSNVRTCGYTEGRMKDVSMLSISPLDRLLNQNDKADSVLVKVGCVGTGSYKSKEYGFDMTKESVNKITCHNGQMPGPGQVCTQDESLQCGPGKPYMIEMFDRVAQRAQGLASPPSLGTFKVTRQMMECMVDNKLQVHFQFGKRQALSGAVACFDHVDYIRTGRRADSTVEIQDEIPFTTLNICHKNSQDSKRCFVYGYQVTILVVDSDRNPAARYPMLEPRIYAKISFNQILSKMVILPGDQVSVRFASDYTPDEGLRIQPNIDDPAFPSPMKERYQVKDPSGAVNTRLPCNDMKVADTVKCENFVAYCTGPDDRITLTVQGAGSVFSIDQTCKDFFKNDEDWIALQAQLDADVSKFNANFQDDQGNAKEFKISKVNFQNKQKNTVASDGAFFFTYTLGWRFQSKEPCCFAGDYLKHENPSCGLQCTTSQCLLESLKTPNQDTRRMLQATENMAGPDVVPQSYVQATLPLDIPTTKLNLRDYNIPERLLQIFLTNYQNKNEGASRRQNSIVGEFEEGVQQPINLSAEFYEDIGPSYEYDVTDKIEVESNPPAYIKVTKIPKHGNIVVKQFGKQVVLNEGDIVQASLFKGFTYDQGRDACSSKAQDKCKDSFSYVTFSEWVGKGSNQESIININPVSQGVAIASGLSANMMQSATGQPAQITKKVTDVKSETCSNEYPVVLVTWLGVGVISVMVALSFALVKVKQVMNEEVSEEEEIEIKSGAKAPRRESHVPLADDQSPAKQESVDVPFANPKDDAYATKANVTAPKLSEEMEGSIGTRDLKQNGSTE